MQHNGERVRGIGIDILERERVAGIRDLRRFAEYFLTTAELKEFEKSTDPVTFVASRFATKEAVIKAFPGQLGPHDFSIIKEGVKPAVRFISPRMDGYRALVSLSHSTEYVAGYATVVEAA